MHSQLVPELASDVFYEYFGGAFKVEGLGTVGGFTGLSHLRRLGGAGPEQQLSRPILLVGDGADAERGGQGREQHRNRHEYQVHLYRPRAERGDRRRAGGERELGGRRFRRTLEGARFQGPGVQGFAGSISAFACQISDRRSASSTSIRPLRSRATCAPASRIRPTSAISAGRPSAAEFNRPLVEFDRSNTYHAGAEFSYIDLISVRAGYMHDQDGNIKDPTYGLGFSFSKRYRLDWSSIPQAQELGRVHRWSIGFTF